MNSIGWKDFNLHVRGKIRMRSEETTNIERVEKEIGDVLCMIDYLIENCYLSDYLINDAKQAKKNKLKEWSNLYDTRTTN